MLFKWLTILIFISAIKLQLELLKSNSWLHNQSWISVVFTFFFCNTEILISINLCVTIIIVRQSLRMLSLSDHLSRVKIFCLSMIFVHNLSEFLDHSITISDAQNITRDKWFRTSEKRKTETQGYICLLSFWLEIREY